MSCLKILLVFAIAECCGHHIVLQKEIIKHDAKPFGMLAYVMGKWTRFSEIEAKNDIQKRDLKSDHVIPPVEEKPTAPTEEIIEGEKKPAPAPPFFGFQPPDPAINKELLPRSTVQAMNTNILGSIQLDSFNTIPGQMGELHGSLPSSPPAPVPAPPLLVPPLSAGAFTAGPLAVEALAAGPMPEGLLPQGPLPEGNLPEEPLPTPIIAPPPAPLPKPEVVPVNNPVPIQNEPTPLETLRPALFDKTKVRQYAVYAGDVILKYFSQFFNRARLTFNRITSPPSPEPVFQN